MEPSWGELGACVVEMPEATEGVRGASELLLTGCGGGDGDIACCERGDEGGGGWRWGGRLCDGKGGGERMGGGEGGGGEGGGGSEGACTCRVSLATAGTVMMATPVPLSTALALSGVVSAAESVFAAASASAAL